MNEQAITCNGIRNFSGWIEELGISDTTAWRWRNRGWFKTLNISGRTYIDQAEIDRFLQRVREGEFAKTLTVPQNGDWQKRQCPSKQSNQPDSGEAKEGSNEP